MGCRSPHGERGLKLVRAETVKNESTSLPSRGAWIEIVCSLVSYGRDWSLPSRGAWIEIRSCSGVLASAVPSLPSRGAWIEIYATAHLPEQELRVAPLTGSVD